MIYYAIRGFLRNIPARVWAFLQRGWRGYADRDLWSLANYLSHWMPAALRTYAQRTHSYPCNTTEAEWTDLLEQMAAGFAAYARWIDDDFEDGAAGDRLEAQGRVGVRLFAEWFADLWD